MIDDIQHQDTEYMHDIGLEIGSYSNVLRWLIKDPIKYVWESFSYHGSVAEDFESWVERVDYNSPRIRIRGWNGKKNEEEIYQVYFTEFIQSLWDACPDIDQAKLSVIIDKLVKRPIDRGVIDFTDERNYFTPNDTGLLNGLVQSSVGLLARFGIEHKVSWKTALRKFKEETKEFKEEIRRKDLEHAAEEAVDVMVTMINAMQSINNTDDDLSALMRNAVQKVIDKNDAKNRLTHRVHNGLITRKKETNGRTE